MGGIGMSTHDWRSAVLVKTPFCLLFYPVLTLVRKIVNRLILQDPRETKVSDLNSAIVANQAISRCQISVKAALLRQILHALADLQKKRQRREILKSS